MRFVERFFERLGPSAARRREAFDALRRGALDEAARILEPLLEIAPDDARNRHLAGLLHLYRGEAAAALRCLERAVAIDADRAGWWYDLGEARRLSSLTADAAEAYARALDIDSGFRPAAAALYEALVTHARARLDAGDFSASEAALGRAIALAPLREDAQQALVATIEAAVKAGAAACAQSETPAATPDLPSFSIVICSIDPAKFERVTAMYRTLLAGVRHEIIGIHDARSLCEGYNRGIDRSEGDVIVFSHDDVEILEPAFAHRLAAHVARHDLVGVCGTSRLTDGHWHTAGWPHLRGLVAHHYPDSGRYRVLVLDGDSESAGDVQGLDGLFLAARRSLVERLRFDEQTFDAFHLYDLDYSYAAYLQGYDVGVCHDIPIIHYTYADTAGYLRSHAEHLERFREKYRGRLASVERGNTRFFQATFDDKAQVKSFCDALIAARRAVAPRVPRG